MPLNYSLFQREAICFILSPLDLKNKVVVHSHFFARSPTWSLSPVGVLIRVPPRVTAMELLMLYPAIVLNRSRTPAVGSVNDTQGN